MNFETASIIIIAGCFSLVAVFVSKFSNFCNKKTNGSFKNAYECGIGNNTHKFIFLTHNIVFVMLAIALEFIAILLALCCFLDIKDTSWHGDIFIRLLLGVLIVSLILSYQIAIRNPRNKKL